MAQKSRELSQFSSFLEVDNNNKNIGIATGATPYVGIGTTNPSAKFTVIGDTNISGVVSATGYYLNGSSLVSAEVQTWIISGSDVYRQSGNVGIGSTIPGSKLTVSGNGFYSGVVTATTFIGNLTGTATSATTAFSINSTSNLNTSGIITASRFVSNVSDGTAPFTVSSTTQVSNLNASLLAGKSPPTGTIVGTTDTQTLSNKTLSFPVISTISNSGTLTLPTGTCTIISTNSSGLVTSGMIADGTIVNGDISASAGITYSKLNLSGSIVNGDISASAGITYSKLNLSGSIVNADISASAGIANSKLANSTISGKSLGSNLDTLTFGTYLTGTSYNGSSAVTIGLNASPSDTSGNTVVVRSNGDFTANDITATSIIPTKISAGSTTGTSGQVLKSTGTGIEWGSGTSEITNDINTNSTYYPVFVTATSGIATQISVSSTKLNYNPSSGNFSATQFTSLSDQTQKTDIRPIENSIEITKKLKGVRFNWIDNNKPSLGLIAQEVEKVLPELIESGDDGLKRVNYSNMIALLIEAIKEQDNRIQELERKLNA